MSKKLGLALGAGGSRGVAHIGVLRALEEEGITPSFISGSSMGAIIGACYAKGMTLDKMLEAVLKLKTVQILDPATLPVKQLGLFKGNKMNAKLLENIGDIDFADLKIPFTCVANDLLSGKCVTLGEGKVAPAVCASSTIPGVFKPYRLNGMLLIDGGVLCRVPNGQVWDMGAEAVIAVDVLTNTYEERANIKNLMSMVFRVYDMMDGNAAAMKKKLTARRNEIWIEPEIPNMSQYVTKDMDKAYEIGYASTKAKMEEIKKMLAD